MRGLLCLKKNTKYMIVYNNLYKQIKNGGYPIGSKLPTEEELREQFHVSRDTVRLAIDMLKDDGYIKSKQGLGNYIIKNINEDRAGMEVIGNPFYKSVYQEIDNVDMEITTEVATERDKELLTGEISVLARTKRWFQFKEKNYGFCESTLSPIFVSEMKLDLHDDQQIKTFLEETVYRSAKHTVTEIFYVYVKKEKFERVIENKMKNDYMMIMETLFDQSGDVIVINKFYIPLTICRIRYTSHQ